MFVGGLVGRWLVLLSSLSILFVIKALNLVEKQRFSRLVKGPFKTCFCFSSVESIVPAVGSLFNEPITQPVCGGYRF